ncbi:hypothetical protein Goshw_010382 [Gossypium schwendimanii]|uniref:Uncharacterized protein n=1 Tax=Gossypium schwendimanii TaxID=34291 RepID=A0A7J9L8R5_GOSSC|nr:hypothetical protein [Gossypium schwendimanii]
MVHGHASPFHKALQDWDLNNMPCLQVGIIHHERLSGQELIR